MSLPPTEGGRVPMRRGVPGPQGGGVFLSRVQQTRLLDAAVEVVAEEGFKRLSATRVASYAGMSSKTFYDLFADSEDCFLAVFDRAAEELAAAGAPAWAGEGEWVQRVRAALTALLGALERDLDLARVVFVEALGAGPRVLARRAEVLDRVAGLIDQGREGSPLAGELPSLVAAGVVGAAFSVIHARLSQEPRESGSSLLGLVGPVMATIVLPYRGREASAWELAHPTPVLPELPDPEVSSESLQQAGDDASTDPGEAPIAAVRPTKRTYMVLAAVSELGGASNREIGEGAEIFDPAQISKMLARLEEHGLVENRGGRTPGFAKAWWLTASGEEFLRTGRVGKSGAAPFVGRVRPVKPGRPTRAGRAGAARDLKRGGALVRRTHTDAVECRRTLLLRAAAAAVDECGYGGVTVARVAARARVSRRTFYELFVDREQCLLAVMQDIDAQITAELRAGDLVDLPWRERVRVGLWRVLGFFDREPGLARFCVVESARGDDLMAAYRAELLARIAGVIAVGSGESLLVESSPLVAEGVAGAIVSILSTRLAVTGRRAARVPGRATPAGGPLSDLFGELMGLIVLPYLGSAVAQEERSRPVPADPAAASLPVPAPGGKQGGRYLALDPSSSLGSRLRMTYRTALVLDAIAKAPGSSNLDVARHAQVNDQGQISKLLSRLELNGLVQNTGRGQSQGAPNEWRLTLEGQKVELDIRGHAHEHEKRAA